jgi:N-methylhydantoinase B
MSSVPPNPRVASDAVGSTALSPITLEVVRNALYAIAEEMSVIVMRSARSPLLKEAGDLSSALTDAEGRLIAQGRDIPMHMGVMGFTVKEFLKRVPASELRDGDVWFLNLPEVGGNHLPDVKAVRPIFYQGTLVAFAINLAHWADIGGAVPGSYVPWATECYQEGLRIAPIRLFSAEGPERHHIDLVLSNLRGREEREGDLFAQFAANDVAARRLVELCDRYGPDTLTACFERLHAESEIQMRTALRSLPDGVWEGEDWLDDDGVEDRLIRVKVRVESRGGELTFDFTGTDDQARGPVNTTYFITCSSVYYAVKALIAPDVPPNEGCYRPIEVIVPPGTLLRADPDRPVVGGNHETSQRVVDAIFKALAPVLPDRIAAGGPTTAGLLIFGARRPDGRWGILYEVHGGGEGATAAKDGAPAVRVHMSNVMNTPVEVIEHEYPIRVEEHALREGSGGDGLHRGGLGFRRAYRMLAPETTLTTMFERRVVPPWGAAGGADGLPFRLTLDPGPDSRELRGKESVRLGPGDLVLIETSGGGGFGSPSGRSADARALDHREGYAQ